VADLSLCCAGRGGGPRRLYRHVRAGDNLDVWGGIIMMWWCNEISSQGWIGRGKAGVIAWEGRYGTESLDRRQDGTGCFANDWSMLVGDEGCEHRAVYLQDLMVFISLICSHLQ
jgi:hypothetical protein